MTNFVKFRDAVNHQFNTMAKHSLFVVNISGSQLADRYLSAFPEGTDAPSFVRTEHNCSACRSFIKQIGNVVAINGNKIMTIWDVDVPAPYDVVAKTLKEMVLSAKIVSPFYCDNKKIGIKQNAQTFAGSSDVLLRNHLYVEVPSSAILSRHSIQSKIGEINSQQGVFTRGLAFDVSSLETVLDLINQGSLYRGDEHKFAVSEFMKIKQKYDALKTATQREIFVWSQMKDTPASVKMFKNTVIGTLVADIDDGVDLDDAVRRFESKVAPANYKRPTSVVTQKMIEAAKKTVSDLGYETALHRRFAQLQDISVNNVIFADRKSRSAMHHDVFDELTAKATSASDKKYDKVDEVSIDDFIANILPKATAVEVMVENSHVSNFVSLIAPKFEDSKNMFKWGNSFSWTYTGDVTDSIKERVKNAGGNVTGDLCCRLAWYNYDDLDLHLHEPSGNVICFRDKISWSGGRLDVDMNAGYGITREPVENIFFEKESMLSEKGVYELRVNQFNRRENTNSGFEVDIDFKGNKFSFSTTVSPKTRETVTVAKFTYSKKDGIKFVNGTMKENNASKEIWNISTNKFTHVNAIMLSPNYWDGNAVGNKHFFFMLDGCKNEDTARGFYNEFLTPELDKNRKVLELVGNRMRIEPVDNQLSGIGFSSTKKNHLLCRRLGSFTRVVKVVF